MKNDAMRLLRQKVFALTKDMIQRFGPRPTGSDACLSCGDAIADEMGTYADRVEKQSFSVHSGAFLGWIRMLVLAYVAGMVLIWFAFPWITVLLMIFSLLVLVIQFIFYKALLDRFYKKRPAMNVIGTVEPLHDVKEQIIISGHHDSAHVFNFLVHQPSLYQLRVTGSILLVIILLIYAMFLTFFGGFEEVQFIINIALSVSALWVIQMWFFVSKQATPGAGDNLIASNIAVVLGEHFSKNRLQHTRLKLVSFDAEEEGLRGARAYAKAYREELIKWPTTLLNADCLYKEKSLFFLTTDINGTVRLDESLANELSKIAKELDIKTKISPLAFLTGGTDAGELAKIGVRATTLIGMPWSNRERANVYHTMQDTIDQVEKRVVESALTIFKTYIERADQKK